MYISKIHKDTYTSLCSLSIARYVHICYTKTVIKRERDTVDTAQEATAGTDTRAAPLPSILNGGITMNTIEISTQVQNLREYRRMAEEIQAEIDSIQDSLKSLMTAQNVDYLDGPDFKITWKSVSTSRLDGKALKAELPELAARFTKTTTSRRFVVA